MNNISINKRLIPKIRDGYQKLYYYNDYDSSMSLICVCKGKFNHLIIYSVKINK